jgi:hypothetical protein
MNEQPGPFRKADFIAWLRSMPEEYVVGRAGDFCHCPYAEYLVKSLHLQSVVVRAHGIAWGHRGFRRAHPWLIDFIREVDGIKPAKSFVTAGRCLRILEG